MAASFYAYCDLVFFLQPKLDDDTVTIAFKQSLRFWFNVDCKEKLPPSQMETMQVILSHVWNDLYENVDLKPAILEATEMAALRRSLPEL
ncbi:unnamed protein product [Adineta steineri]|uniref:Uncharacterized protein n=1 Tax=Adineta steineri TaxID=433720 RepID=A0A819VDK5_9BILA|nr:unnamed protein product [Adineta steineri]CAF4107550.1 unnamed protein product [Adineta steineri]